MNDSLLGLSRVAFSMQIRGGHINIILHAQCTSINDGLDTFSNAPALKNLCDLNFTFVKTMRLGPVTWL